MNRAIVIGRFAADPELKETSNGVAVTSFTIAVDRPYAKDRERITDWLDIVAWRGTAEFICKHFSKGDNIIVEGSMQTRTWEDKNGQKRKAIEIVAENVEFAPKGRNASAEVEHKANVDEFIPADMEDLPWELG